MVKKSSNKKIFINLFTLPIILSLVGLIIIFEASAVRSFRSVGDSFYYLRHQAVWVACAIVIMLFFSVFDYHKLYYFAFLFMMTTILLLIVVLFPGIGTKVGGARRWIDFGFFNLQPTEFAKFSIIIYLASWLISKERKRFFSFLILLGILMFLILLQPDMGTGIIVFSLSVIIYILAGIDLIYLYLFLPISALGFYILIKLSPYRFNRFLAFFNPSLDPQGITYHINQISISLANGGLFGQGLGVSRQKYLFLPEAHTDSIFAILGEEFGFIGCFIVIFIYLFLIFIIYKIAKNASDRFGRLLAGGIFAFFNLQIIINLAGIVNMLPLTGVPLPFLSYGGSNLLISFAFIGILVNIGRRMKSV